MNATLLEQWLLAHQTAQTVEKQRRVATSSFEETIPLNMVSEMDFWNSVKLYGQRAREVDRLDTEMAEAVRRQAEIEKELAQQIATTLGPVRRAVSFTMTVLVNRHRIAVHYDNRDGHYCSVSLLD